MKSLKARMITSAALGAVAVIAVGIVARCSPAQQAQVNKDLASPAGQLFCAIATEGGPIIAKVITVAAAGVGGVAGVITGPLAVIVTGAIASDVQGACTAAAAATGAKAAVPVAPPPAGAVVATVAIPPEKVPATLTTVPAK